MPQPVLILPRDIPPQPEQGEEAAGVVLLIPGAAVRARQRDVGEIDAELAASVLRLVDGSQPAKGLVHFAPAGGVARGAGGEGGQDVGGDVDVPAGGGDDGAARQLDLLPGAAVGEGQRVEDDDGGGGAVDGVEGVDDGRLEAGEIKTTTTTISTTSRLLRNRQQVQPHPLVPAPQRGLHDAVEMRPLHPPSVLLQLLAAKLEPHRLAPHVRHGRIPFRHDPEPLPAANTATSATPTAAMVAANSPQRRRLPGGGYRVRGPSG
ncbi:hypothetical protein SLS58_007078 [Diplodia intermedia]|uniref:Uncharacterized protein n=1 Tax=Diplodia intermedia TaxID=856260 RepID=A0ABR3TLH7_9PEZI